MANSVKKTTRTALSWDQELIDSVKDLRSYLDRDSDKTSSNWEIFFLCLAFGFKNKSKRSVPPRKSDSVRIEYLKPNQKMMFQSIALFDTDDYLVLMDEDAVYDIVEAYAAGGLKYLTDQMKTNPNFVKWLEGELFQNAEFKID